MTGRHDPADVVGVALAAGAGTRLRPLTRERPKPLCPVGGDALVDLALARLAPAAGALVVNVHHGAAAFAAHFADRCLGWITDDGSVDAGGTDTGGTDVAPAPSVAPPPFISMPGPLGPGPSVHLSWERDVALGTAGALGRLRPWLAGRGALVVNADTWSGADLVGFVRGWDHASVSVLVAGEAPFGPRSRIVASLVPWAEIDRLAASPSGLYEAVWARHAAAGSLVVAHDPSPLVDCGTPGDYLEANLAAAPTGGLVHPAAVVGGSVTGRSVVGAGAHVDGAVHDAVVWPGAVVAAGERLVRGIRTTGGLTVLCR